MALTKAKKAVQIDHLAHELEGSTSAIVGTFAKLTVSQDFELRKVVRSAGGRYRVLKNKLAARASKGTKVEAALQGLKGVSSVAYTSGDPVVLAKALSTWMVENAEYTFKLGIVDGQLISVEEVKQLATMPSKEEIFAKLLFLINAPAQRLATVINATGRDMAVVINQAVEKGKLALGKPRPSGVPRSRSSPAKAAPAAEAAPVPEAACGRGGFCGRSGSCGRAAPVRSSPAAEAAPVAEPTPVEEAVEAAPATISKDAEAAGTNEDSQTAAAAAPEPPVEG